MSKLVMPKKYITYFVLGDDNESKNRNMNLDLSVIYKVY